MCVLGSGREGGELFGGLLDQAMRELRVHGCEVVDTELAPVDAEDSGG